MIAIYARQSIDKKDSISIESQIDFSKKEIVNGEDFKIYYDKGFSGKNTERPKFQEMIKDIKSGLITKVIVYKLDRISRNLLDFANITDTFKKYNVSFTSCNEKFDTSTPIGNAMLNIVMVFAQLERETIQKRIKDNYYARGAKGMYLGGRAPYGFNKIETKLNNKKTYTFEPNSEQLPYLIVMYEMYANSDMSLGRISDYLNNKDILAAEGGKWDSSKVSRLLRNPVYVKANTDIYSYYKNKGCIVSNDFSEFTGQNGCYLYGKRESNERKYTNVENHTLSIALHEGVIDSDMWLLCQYKLDSNKQLKNSGKGKNTWLSGLVKCGYCKYAVSVVKSRNGERYFSCRGKTNLKICDGFSEPIHTRDIEEAVKKMIFKQIKKLDGLNLETKNKHIDEINKLKIELKAVDTQIENLVESIAQGNTVTTKYLNEKISKLDKQKNIILEQIKKFSIEKHNGKDTKEILECASDWNNLTLEKKKLVCKFFINKIFIKEHDIEIEWNKVFE